MRQVKMHCCDSVHVPAFSYLCVTCLVMVDAFAREEENLRCNVHIGPKIAKKSRRCERTAPHFLTDFFKKESIYMSRLSDQNPRLS